MVTARGKTKASFGDNIHGKSSNKVAGMFGTYLNSNKSQIRSRVIMCATNPKDEDYGPKVDQDKNN